MISRLEKGERQEEEKSQYHPNLLQENSNKIIKLLVEVPWEVGVERCFFEVH
jgi:hypothetical protein